MAWVTVYDTVTRTAEQDLGYDLIPICRPKFVFFKFSGLRPSTPHWIFFDGKEVTKWVNTSYTLDDYNNSSRNSNLRNPGDSYLNATSFPSSLGGPTAASGPIGSDATGSIEGVFYIQSNASLSFSTGKKVLSAIDISVPNKQNSLSYAQAEYSAIGQNQLYYEYQYQEQVPRQVWVEPPPPPDDNGGGNDRGDDTKWTTEITYTNGEKTSERKVRSDTVTNRPEPRPYSIYSRNDDGRGDDHYSSPSSSSKASNGSGWSSGNSFY
jgi:hypothetical protein